jgi:hypothetical protein
MMTSPWAARLSLLIATGVLGQAQPGSGGRLVRPGAQQEAFQLGSWKRLCQTPLHDGFVCLCGRPVASCIKLSFVLQATLTVFCPLLLNHQHSQSARICIKIPPSIQQRIVPFSYPRLA